MSYLLCNETEESKETPFFRTLTFKSSKFNHQPIKIKLHNTTRRDEPERNVYMAQRRAWSYPVIFWLR